jgi:glycosyltransferase involved in cell wall biosynthesis
MKLLHLFSNYRWTGPAEPVLNLAGALREAGWDLTFACAQGPSPDRNGVLRHARERRIPANTDLHLSKHRHPIRNLCDVRALRRWMQDERFDLVHANLRNAHVVAAAARRGIERPPLLVRTCFEGDGPSGFTERRLLRRHTDGLIVVSERARRRVIERCRFPADRAWQVDTAIDLERFDPARIDAEQARIDRRKELGLPADAFVVGIIARIQPRRRYDVFLEAVRRAHERHPDVRAVIVGRGTHMKRLVVEPIRRMGLDNVIVLPGYHTGDDYVRTVAAMDVKVYLVPGTDGSCRAAREAMAMGVPLVAARRGMLPELVGDDARGLVIDDTPETLADALLALAEDDDRRHAMGRRARQFAIEHFDLARQAEQVGQIYRTLAERGER